MIQVSLIKLGGSVITVKDRAITPNIEAIKGLSHVLAKHTDSLIIVHGGGSFGHYWSMKYDMHTKPELYDSRGISVVHESMVALNQIIVKSMSDAGLAPYGISPISLFEDGKENVTKFNELVEFTRRGIVPVIFGDVVHISEGRFSIVSGDSLMTRIATHILPSRVIFTVNVDGIYEDMKNKKLVKVLNFPINEISFKDSSIDVTGGMGRKISEAFEIARLGIDVNIVNGLDADRVFDILRGVEAKGTIIPAIPDKGRR
jgi:isopentenyl phosphate kinase